uniref:mitogen-activated protein kinase kinase n=1 Tax=Gasterosteus aculeatus aculeatus TaxID=481459 RepID=A0AAQ4NVQ9_GASAC
MEGGSERDGKVFCAAPPPPHPSKGEMSQPNRGKKKLKLPKEAFEQPPPAAVPPRDLDSKACVTIGEKNFEVKADDLEQICELGRGAYGVVDKMRHVPSGLIMAVKRIRATVNTQEQKRLLMDLDISMRTVDCFYTVTFYGALFREGDVWICMELMDTSLDKFYKQVIEKGRSIPEDILGKIAVSIVKALEHLHSNLQVIHRDVKPSNVLINTQGQVKMCDFGISGYLVDSVAKTMDARLQTLHGAGEDQPRDQPEGLQRQVGHLEFGNHDDRAGHPALPLRLVGNAVPAAEAGGGGTVATTSRRAVLPRVRGLLLSVLKEGFQRTADVHRTHATSLLQLPRGQRDGRGELREGHLKGLRPEGKIQPRKSTDRSPPPPPPPPRRRVLKAALWSHVSRLLLQRCRRVGRPESRSSWSNSGFYFLSFSFG